MREWVISPSWLSWGLYSGFDAGLAGDRCGLAAKFAFCGCSWRQPIHPHPYLAFFLAQNPDFGWVLGPESSIAHPQAQCFPTFPESESIWCTQCFIKFKGLLVSTTHSLRWKAKFLLLTAPWGCTWGRITHAGAGGAAYVWRRGRESCGLADLNHLASKAPGHRACPWPAGACGTWFQGD